MTFEILSGLSIAELDKLSRELGNIPLLAGSSISSIMRDDAGKIKGFASVQTAVHASGSWVDLKYRRQRHTYTLREVLEDELRRLRVPVYFSIPQNDFEKSLFAKYGAVEEKIVQVKKL